MNEKPTPAQAFALKCLDDANTLRKAADDLTDLAHLVLRVEAQPELLNDMLSTTSHQAEAIRKSLPRRNIEEKAS
jgi:hypothetical protein